MHEPNLFIVTLPLSVYICISSSRSAGVHEPCTKGSHVPGSRQSSALSLICLQGAPGGPGPAGAPGQKGAEGIFGPDGLPGDAGADGPPVRCHGYLACISTMTRPVGRHTQSAACEEVLLWVLTLTICYRLKDDVMITSSLRERLETMAAEETGETLVIPVQLESLGGLEKTEMMEPM